MTERPILFSGPMVQVILDGRKTMTRRIAKGIPEDVGLFVPPKPGDEDPAFLAFQGGSVCSPGRGIHRCPYGVPGDRLWVRETWAIHQCVNDCPPAGVGPWLRFYRSDYTEGVPGRDVPIIRWRPSIHMPRAASRITLEVVSVRVERLQQITEDDARAEGAVPFPNNPDGDCWTDGTHRSAFEYLWNETYGWNPNAWNSNPWVWAVTFKRVEV